MKHRTIKLLIFGGIVFCIMMLSSCGVSDWIYDLPNGYFRQKNKLKKLCDYTMEFSGGRFSFKR